MANDKLYAEQTHAVTIRRGDHECAISTFCLKKITIVLTVNFEPCILSLQANF